MRITRDTARVIAERLAWRGRLQPAGLLEDPATMARSFAYLFGLGGVLLLASLGMPAASDRAAAQLLVITVLAFLTAVAFLVLFDRIPI